MHVTGQSNPLPELGEDELTEAERALIAAAATGAMVDLRTGDTADNPANGANWPADRTVRAGLLADLLTGERVPPSGRVRAINICGARVVDRLDLQDRKIVCPLLMGACSFEEAIVLNRADAMTVRLPGCHVPGLFAALVHVAGSVELNEGFTTDGPVRLLGAHVDGQLAMNAATLKNPCGTALAADGLIVGQGMFCGDNFEAEGEVRLIDARIHGPLDLNQATLNNSDGPSLNADGLTVDRDMHCGNGFRARGEIRLPGAHIGGQFSLLEATILRNQEGVALHADGLDVCGDLTAEGLSADGEVRLLGAHIGGQFTLRGATLDNRDGEALFADGLIVDRGMFCRVRRTAQGETRFTTHGEVRLVGAHIGGQLDLCDATLNNPGGHALTADYLVVDEGMFFRDRSTAHGEVCLAGAQIRQEGLDVETMRLFDPGECSLALNGATLTVLRLPNQKPAGAINLSDAKVGALIDDPDACPEVLRLRGFVYDSLQNQDISCRSRLQWVRRHPERFVPQIYDQLADCYRRAGEDAKARKVMVAKQWRRRHAWSPLSLLWYVTVGYGYRAWQALLWLAVLSTAGTAVFSHAHMVSVIAHPPAFHPFIYTLDLLMPVVGLGQKAAWQPTGNGLEWFSFALTGAGWVLATAVVAGLTGILNRSKWPG